MCSLCKAVNELSQFPLVILFPDYIGMIWSHFNKGPHKERPMRCDVTRCVVMRCDVMWWDGIWCHNYNIIRRNETTIALYKITYCIAPEDYVCTIKYQELLDSYIAGRRKCANQLELYPESGGECDGVPHCYDGSDEPEGCGMYINIVLVYLLDCCKCNLHVIR